jgi:DNA-binding PadR family transcriptional regulator
MHYYKEPNSLYAVTDSGVEEVELTLEEIAHICEAYEARVYHEALEAAEHKMLAMFD